MSFSKAYCFVFAITLTMILAINANAETDSEVEIDWSKRVYLGAPCLNVTSPFQISKAGLGLPVVNTTTTTVNFPRMILNVSSDGIADFSTPFVSTFPTVPIEDATQPVSAISLLVSGAGRLQFSLGTLAVGHENQYANRVS